MTLTRRLVKGSELTFAEGDDNIDHLEQLTQTAQAAASSAASAASVAQTTAATAVAAAATAQTAAVSAQSTASSATSAAGAAQGTANAAAAAAAASSQPGHTHILSDVANLLEFIQDEMASALTAGANITLTYNDATGKLIVASAGAAGGSTLADGDYGDVVVSVGGTVINLDTVTLSTFGRTLTGAADQAAGRTALGLGTAATFSSASFAPLDGPTFTGAPSAPTAAPGTTTTQLATTAFAMTAVADGIATLTGAAPAALDTVFELAAALNNNPNAFTVLNNAIAAKQDGSTVLTFLAGAATADAAGVRTRLGLGTAAVAAAGDFAAAAHAHSNATTSAAGFMSAADKSKLDSVQDAAATIGASRALATTDSNTEAIVSNGVALTLNSDSLTDGTPFGGTAATGAVFTMVVGTASLKLYHGGPALAGGTVISSARSQAGKITIERKGSDYILLEPVLSVPSATITTSGALPARTVEDKQHVIVSVAGGAVALDCSGATGWAAGDLARGMFFRIIGGGAAKLSFTGANVVNPDAKTFGSGQVCALVGDPTTANTVWVIG